MPSTISYDPTLNDFLINGKSLLKHLQIHEDVKAGHLPAILCQEGSIQRLLGQGTPDLRENHIALYLCGHCGGYDSAIGLKVSLTDHEVHWYSMGYHEDYEEGESWPFMKVRGYTFDRCQYENFTKDLAVWAI